MSSPEESKPDFLSLQVENSDYVFFDLVPDKERTLTINCAGRELCDADYTLVRESFPFYAIEFIAAGNCNLELTGKTYTLGPGDVFAYLPDSKHSISAVKGKRFLKYFIDFSGIEAANSLKQSSLATGTPRSTIEIRWIRQIFDQVIGCNEMAKVNACTMGNKLLELLILRIQHDTREYGGNEGEANIAYQRCRNYIRKNFKQLLSMDQVSRACNLDPAYLSRLFKQHAKESPYQYLTRLKMEYSAELITHENRSVKATASAIGFEDAYHFSRVFKRYYGIAPKFFSRNVRPLRTTTD